MGAVLLHLNRHLENLARQSAPIRAIIIAGLGAVPKQTANRQLRRVSVHQLHHSRARKCSAPRGAKASSGCLPDRVMIDCKKSANTVRLHVQVPVHFNSLSCLDRNKNGQDMHDTTRFLILHRNKVEALDHVRKVPAIRLCYRAYLSGQVPDACLPPCASTGM